MSTIAVAVLASGAGTTADAFVRNSLAAHSPCETRLVICNTPQAGIFEKVSRLNAELGTHIDSLLINSKTHPAAANEQSARGRQTNAEQAAILSALKSHNIDLVILLGYMKHIGQQLITEYGWLPTYTSIYQARMLNTHPGLLPLTQGLSGIHVQEKVLSAKAPEAGQTLHLVSAAYDDGPTIAEHRTMVVAGETADQLFARVQLIEKAHIASDIATFASEQQAYKTEGRA